MLGVRLADAQHLYPGRRLVDHVPERQRQRRGTHRNRSRTVFVTCSLASCSPPSAIAAGTTFTLTINQTNPSPGTAGFTGSLQGNIGFNPDNSTLTWITTGGVVTIGNVVYTLVTDNFASCQNIALCINVASPNSGGNPANPNTTTVKAFVVTPEPSSIALMATGIFGLVPVAMFRRRRR